MNAWTHGRMDAWTQRTARCCLVVGMDKQVSSSTSTRVRLNVGGRVYETCVSTLQQYPDTLLGTMFDPRNEHMVKRDADGGVFIDRNGKVSKNYYRTGGSVSPFTSTQYSPQAIQSEVDFFQLPCAPPQEQIDEQAKIGESVAKKAVEAARAAVDDNLYTLLLRQIQKALFHAAEQGLHTITIKFSRVGQTFFGQDLVGTPIYMITNAGAKDIFMGDQRRSLLLHDLNKMGLSVKETPIESGMITETIWRLTFELYKVPK